MCFNVGKADRVIRIIAGIVLIAYGFIANSTLVAVIGLVPLVTGVFGFCPLYPIFKINTGCKKES